MLSVSPGHHWRYLTEQVGKGRENYFTKATEAGEPPGVWGGAGAANLGLSGEVSEAQMAALYGEFVDPRDPGFGDTNAWATAEKLGQAPRQFRSREEILAAMLAKEPGASPERIEELTASSQRQARKAVAFIDLTFSPQKSVSVLHTSLKAQQIAAERAGDTAGAEKWAAQAQAVEDAVWAGNQAMLEYAQREAGYSRVGYHGPRQPGQDSVGRYVDAHGWVIASFFQHTSRPTAAAGEQPQLHIHNAVLNRVECPDGKWRTLDSRAIHKIRGAAGALAERVMEEYLTRSLGVEFRMRPDGRAREVVGIDPEVRDLFSARRQAITERVAQYVEAYKERTGREPNALELSRLSQQATKHTREKKLPNATTLVERVGLWTRQLRDHVDQALTTVAERAIGRINDPATAAQAFSPSAVVAKALDEVQSTKSHWSRYDLLRAINKHLPDCLGGLTTAHIERVREELADYALNPDAARVGSPEEVWRLTAPEIVAPPNELRRSDGTSMYRPHGSDQYATRAQIQLEEQLETAAQRSQGAVAAQPEVVRSALAEINARLAADGKAIGDDQSAALFGILTSGRPVETLIGPAGTGKSFTLGTLSELWEERLGHGRVFGLALAQNAANVLREEGIERNENISQWLATQRNLEQGTAPRAAREEWGLGAGDLVVVDESGMADTAKLAEVQQRATAAGAKVLFVGDDRQLSAVGAGGALSLVMNAGTTYELDEVRRFANGWERDASLRLRAGDPDVLSMYERHGRLIDGGLAEEAGQAAVRGWLADTLAGRHSLIVADTNEQAGNLSKAAQAELVRLGLVGEPEIELAHEDAAGTAVGVGDLIQARRNDRKITTEVGNWIVNRGNYRVIATNLDGSMIVRAVTGRDENGETLGGQLHLPADYVRDNVTLGYATTVHGAQGQTVDTCHSLISKQTRGNAAYVALTRGRDANIAYVITRELNDDFTPDAVGDRPQLAPGEELPTPIQILGDVIERDQDDMAAIEFMRRSLTNAESLTTLGAIWTDVQQQYTAPNYEEILRQLLPPELAEKAIDDDAIGPLWRVVRAAEMGGTDARTILSHAVHRRGFSDAESIAQVLHWRVIQAHGAATIPTQNTYVERTMRAEGPLPEFAMELAQRMEQRVTELGEQALDDPPAWAVQHLGPVPNDPVSRLEWAQQAGRAMAYREQYAHEHDTDAIGPTPPVGNPEARGTWYAAWRALGEPDLRPDEATQSVGQLHNAVAAYEREKAWGPAWVGEDLRDTTRAARTAFEQAEITAAQARAETDPERKAELTIRAHNETERARQLDGERQQLETIDEIRGEWYLATGETREAAARAEAELHRRGADTDPTTTPITAARSQLLGDLVESGVLTDEQRREIAQDPAADAMWRLVDRQEETGKDPRDVLARAVRQRELGTAESLAQVLHYRLTKSTKQELAKKQIDVPERDITRETGEPQLEETQPTETESDTHPQSDEYTTQVLSEEAERARLLADQLRQAMRARAIIEERRVAEAESEELEQSRRAAEERDAAERDERSLEL